MKKFMDVLRGYAYKIHQRDNFRCCCCGVDGRRSFDTWLTPSCNHLLPKGHPNRVNLEYVVVVFNFYNTADDHYFELAQ